MEAADARSIDIELQNQIECVSEKLTLRRKTSAPILTRASWAALHKIKQLSNSKLKFVTRGGFKPPSCANCMLHIDLVFTAAFMRPNCRKQIRVLVLA